MGKPETRTYLMIAAGIAVIQWLVFTIFYPYPQMVYDSYAYLKAADLHLGFNAWPIGYSWFIELFHFFSNSARWLVTVQFFLLQVSCCVFFASWRRFFNPGNICSGIVFTLLFLNPVFLFCSNFILSDVLFIMLSLLWMSQLIWVVGAFKPWMTVTHALLLVATFTVRYQALYFPLIGALAFWLSGQRWYWKMAGIVLPVLLAGWFVFYTRDQVAVITGKPQFSPFGAWKLANDALYVYAHVGDEEVRASPPKFAMLDSIVRQNFRQSPVKPDMLTEDPSSGSYFMLDGGSPLKQYVSLLQGNKPWGYREWLAIAPFYQSYGLYLIRTYPGAVVRYFCRPNLVRYALPPREVLGSRLGFYFDPAHGTPYVEDLFGQPPSTTAERSIRMYEIVLYPYPYILLVSHLIFVAGMIGILLTGIWKDLPAVLRRILLLTGSCWLVDFAFSLLSAGIVLRYQLFMGVIEMTVGLYSINLLIHGKIRRLPISIA